MFDQTPINRLNGVNWNRTMAAKDGRTDDDDLAGVRRLLADITELAELQMRLIAGSYWVGHHSRHHAGPALGRGEHDGGAPCLVPSRGAINVWRCGIIGRRSAGTGGCKETQSLWIAATPITNGDGEKSRNPARDASGQRCRPGKS
jgi:hypothetical protein